MLKRMPWDGFPRVVDGRTHTAKQVFQERLVPSAVAVYVSVKSGNAYAALPDDDGEVYPVFYAVEEANESDDDDACFLFKQFSIHESPYRWPAAVANAITRWE